MATNDVIMTKSFRTHLQINACAKFKVDRINTTSQSGAKNENTWYPMGKRWKRGGGINFKRKQELFPKNWERLITRSM